MSIRVEKIMEQIFGESGGEGALGARGVGGSKGMGEKRQISNKTRGCMIW